MELTQRELAQRAGLSKSSVERIEHSADGAGVKLNHLVTLALVLECELLDLVDDDWLVRGEGDFFGASTPARTTLERRAGGADPPYQRDRAPRRRQPSS